MIQKFYTKKQKCGASDLFFSLLRMEQIEKDGKPFSTGMEVRGEG
jgi:hypothetical protein